MKDYYIILGVDADATLQEIKSAYRRQAKKLHPDYHGPDCAPFRDVQEAYECLSDPDRRQAHDYALACARRTPASRVPAAEPLWSSRSPVEPIDLDCRSGYGYGDWGDVFHSPLFDPLWDDFNLESLDEQTLQVQVNLNRKQAAQGGRLSIPVSVRATCPLCQGSGQMMRYRCPHCDGQGSMAGQYPVTVTFPAGITSGTIGHVWLEQLALHLVLYFRVSAR